MRQGTPCYGKRYVKNLAKNEVHDLNNEKPNCQIDEIKRLSCYGTLAEAKAGGADNCAYCLGNSTR